MATLPSSLRTDLLMYLSRRMNRSLCAPDWLSVNVTLRCNLHCLMCNTCYPLERELGTTEILDIVDQAAIMGVKVFNPLGGEPFTRPDLEEILAHAAGKDLFTTLTTNGTLISRARAAGTARIAPEKLHVNISLDGPEPTHDAIRGRGTFQAAITGYQRLRLADESEGNPRRKILANTLVLSPNLSSLPDFARHLRERGFDGIRLLSLYRDPAPRGDPRKVEELWIHRERLPELEDVLLALRDIPGPGSGVPFLQNSPQELRLMLRHYRGNPSAVPCWAGWKELYINADGSAVMCDAHLDFLAGRFGDIHTMTLRQLWQSQALRDRRRQVLGCRTPCSQTCYLRPQSDSLPRLAGRLGSNAGRQIRSRISASSPRKILPRRWKRVHGGLLTLELSDVCDCSWSSCSTPASRLGALLHNSPGTLDACYREPKLWQQWRDRHHVDFGRGFMGFELVKQVVRDLRAAHLGFDTLALRWRGEPLLHPEFTSILPYLLTALGPGQPFSRLLVETNALLLTPDVATMLVQTSASQVDLFLDLDRMGPYQDLALMHLEPLLSRRRPGLNIVACRRAHLASANEGAMKAEMERWCAMLDGNLRVAGLPPPPSRDAFWLRRRDPGTFTADSKAQGDLLHLAHRLALRCTTPERETQRRCGAPLVAPTVSWDGKVTICPWDTFLELRVGEVTRLDLSRIWRSGELRAIHQDISTRGLPAGRLCMDCHRMYSPNHPGATSPGSPAGDRAGSGGYHGPAD